jgi:hypothetical protein
MRHGRDGTAMPRVVRPAGGPGGRVPFPVLAEGVRVAHVYGRVHCFRRRLDAQVDPRWSRHHRDPDTGQPCSAWETEAAPCNHEPPRASDGLLDDLEASRPVVITAWELWRHVCLAPHPAVQHPWEDPRWFRVTADDLITEVDEPESEQGCMYPASGPFAAIQSWADDDEAVLDS